MSLDFTGSLTSGSDDITDKVADSIGELVSGFIKTALDTASGN